MSNESNNNPAGNGAGNESVQLFDDNQIAEYLNSEVTAVEDAATLIELGQNDPTLLQDPEIGKFFNLADEQVGKDNETQQNLNADGKPKKQDDDAGADTGGNAGDEVDDEDEEGADDGTQVFVTKKQPGRKSLDNVTAENYNELLAQELNIEVTDDESAKKLVGSIRKFRADSTKLNKVLNENEQFKQFYAGLPKKLLVGLTAYAKGEDYDAALSSYKPSIEFSKQFSELSDDEKTSVLNHYYPNIETQGKKLDDPDLQKLLPNLERLYSAEKKSYDISVANETAKAKQFNTDFASAVKASADAFAAEYSEVFTKSTITSLTRQLENGKWKDSLFDSKGLPKPDAIKRLAYLIYGEDYVQQVKAGNSATKKSEKTAETIKNQPKTPVVKKAQTGIPESDGLLKELEAFRDSYSKSPY